MPKKLTAETIIGFFEEKETPSFKEKDNLKEKWIEEKYEEDVLTELELPPKRIYKTRRRQNINTLYAQIFFGLLLRKEWFLATDIVRDGIIRIPTDMTIRGKKINAGDKYGDSFKEKLGDILKRMAVVEEDGKKYGDIPVLLYESTKKRTSTIWPRYRYKVNEAVISTLARHYALSEREALIIEDIWLNPSTTPKGIDIGDSERLITVKDIWRSQIDSLLEEVLKSFIDPFVYQALYENAMIIILEYSQIKSGILALDSYSGINLFSNNIAFFLLAQMSKRIYADRYLEAQCKLLKEEYRDVMKEFINQQILMELGLYPQIENYKEEHCMGSDPSISYFTDNRCRLEFGFEDHDLVDAWKKIIAFIKKESKERSHLIPNFFGPRWNSKLRKNIIQYIGSIADDLDSEFISEIHLSELPFITTLRGDKEVLIERLGNLENFLEKNST